MPGPPDKIMLIRHAEKPVGVLAGVTEDGLENKHSLIVRGWRRAGALVQYFGAPTRDEISVPSLIFAAGTSNDLTLGEDVAKSLRSQQTVQGLSKKFDIKLRTDIPVGDEKSLDAALHEFSGVVLVCWEHKRIPIIARGFSQKAPSEWGDRFDVVWILDRATDGTYSFKTVNQDLLENDPRV